PGVGHTGDRGRVTNARLVVDVVGAPEGDPLALQVAAFVAGLGRAAVEQRVGPGFFANLEQLVADLLDGILPGNALPLAVDQLHRILDALFAVPVLADGGPLGAVRTQIQGRVEIRFLPRPDAILHFRNDAAAHRTVRADAELALDLGAAVTGVVLGLGSTPHAPRQGAGQRRAAALPPEEAGEG